MRSRVVRLLVVACVVGAAGAAGAQGTMQGARHGHAGSAALEARLTKALASPYVDPGRTGALAVDLRTGQVVYQHNAARALVPASTEKLTVAYAALKQLGPGFRFHTEVLGAGKLVGDQWHGNLYLVGHGDPTLRMADIGRLARDVKAAGIRRVTGSVIADERHFDARRGAPGWKPYFIGIESAPLSALVVNGARLSGANSSATVAATALALALARRGVAVAQTPREGRVAREAVPLAIDHSAKLGVIVQEMNRSSDNFVAEMLLKEVGAFGAGRGSTVAGSAVVRNALSDAGVPMNGVRIVDGSGLSSLDRLTARSLVALLRTGAVDPSVRRAFVSSLPVAGVSGTLRNRLAKRPTLRRVVAKTGTTSISCSLAGFVGDRYAFAILQNGSPVSYWSARLAQDRFVTVLARS
jgi:D-alanyl-D-alanine carboxypeptidase/D-alanyl-D-alanine-endopeptidase (penicillin-binding protein 4)